MRFRIERLCPKHGLEPGVVAAIEKILPFEISVGRPEINETYPCDSEKVWPVDQRSMDRARKLIGLSRKIGKRAHVCPCMGEVIE